MPAGLAPPGLKLARTTRLKVGILADMLEDLD